MSDYNSSLPIRTETNGDAAVKVVDGTVTSRALLVNADGSVVSRLADAGGTLVTSQTNGTQRALDVGIDVAGVQIDPRSIRALTSGDVVTAQQGTSPWVENLTQVGGAAISLGQKVSASSLPVVIASDQSAIFTKLEDGSGNAITSQVNGSQRALDVGINVAGVQIDPRQIRALTSTDVVSSNIRDATGTAFSTTNPLPVAIVSTVAGSTEVLDFKQAASIAAGASDTHTYTVTTGKTLFLQHIQASASGKIKVEIQLNNVLKLVYFNSTSSPNIDYIFGAPQSLAAALTVKVIITNYDKQAQDVYSTIEGYEV